MVSMVSIGMKTFKRETSRKKETPTKNRRIEN
jgi:hypothetical protein